MRLRKWRSLGLFLRLARRSADTRGGRAPRKVTVRAGRTRLLPHARAPRSGGRGRLHPAFLESSWPRVDQICSLRAKFAPGPFSRRTWQAASHFRLHARTRHPMTSVASMLTAARPSACGADMRSSSQTPRAGAGASLHRGAALRVSSMCPALAAPFRAGHKKTHAISQTSAPRTAITPLRVECANPRRVQKVQQQMRREISNMLQTDKVGARSILRATRVAPKP